LITCKVGENIINCYDGIHNKEQLKKWASKNILTCPACGKPYEYCHGEFVQPYFRHKEKNQCEDRYSEPESQEHINGKRDLFEWIKSQNGVTDAILEGWLPDTKQRPDIMFKYHGKQYVIEFQCSPIASEYVERHDLYQTAGIIDIWILGTINYFNTINQTYEQNRRGRKIQDETSYYYDCVNKTMLIEPNKVKTYNFPQYQYKTRFSYVDCIRNINNEIVSCVNDVKKLTISNLNNFIFDNGIIFDDNIKIKIEKDYTEQINIFHNDLASYLQDLEYNKELVNVIPIVIEDKIAKININFLSVYADNSCLYIDFNYYDVDCLKSIKRNIKSIIKRGIRLIEENKENDQLIQSMNSEINKYMLHANYYPKGNIYYNSKFIINSDDDDELYFFIKDNSCDCCSTYDCYYQHYWHTKYKTLDSIEYNEETSLLKEFI
jgi:hypothetical protein